MCIAAKRMPKPGGLLSDSNVGDYPQSLLGGPVAIRTNADRWESWPMSSPSASCSEPSAAVNLETLDLIVRSAALPTMPQVVTRFIELSAEPEYKVDDLVEVLATDPGISSELLRLTNSALFGVTRQVSSLKQAFTLLGLGRVRTLVLGRYMISQIGPGDVERSDFSFSYFWRRSLSTAVLAAKFAHHIAPKYREEAFIGGLLADIGVVILLKSLPQRYGPIAAEYAPLRGEHFLDRELQELGVTHADVGALVLERWMLPPLVVEAVRHHHAAEIPEAAEQEDAWRLAAIIHGSQLIAKLLCEDPRKNPVYDICKVAMDKVGLDVGVLPEILTQVEGTIRELAELLGIELIRSDVYNRISQLIAEELARTTPTS